MYSYLICGQVSSRLRTDVADYFKRLKSNNESTEIVVSTWSGEVPKAAYRFIDRLVISKDPGDSLYGKNWKRILVSTQRGLDAASLDTVVRSRVEVKVNDPPKLKNTVSAVVSSGRFIAFPLDVSLYMFGKGLILSPPDFFQIGAKKNLLDYWDLKPEPNDLQPFCMVTGDSSSLCSDQVLGANFAIKHNGAEHLTWNRYIFSAKNWRAHKHQLEEYFGFFREADAGLDFGRLGRRNTVRFCKFRNLCGNVSVVELSGLALGEFLVRYSWDFQNRRIFNVRSSLGKMKALIQNRRT